MTDREEYIAFLAQLLCRQKALMPRRQLFALADESAASMARRTARDALTETELLHELDAMLLKQLRVMSFHAWSRERGRPSGD